MNFKKSFLSFSGFLMTLAPTLTVVACGENEDVEKILTIQVEKEWESTYQEIIDDFEKEYHQVLEDNGIEGIELVITGSFENETIIKDKGIRDESLADIFLLKADRIAGSLQYIRPYSCGTWDEWAEQEKDYIGENNSLDSNAALSVETATRNGDMYGVPQNIEAMVSVSVADPSDVTQYITKFSDLWMSVGYFNEVDPISGDVIYNMKDIVVTDSQGKIVNNFNDQQNYIKDGFVDILEAIQELSPNLTNITAFDMDSSKADPVVQDYFKTNQSNTAILTGPWDIVDGQYLGLDVNAYGAPDDWNQWGGSWLYVLNNRITDSEAIVAEHLIAYILNPINAADIYNGAGKISPLAEGMTEIQNSDKVSESSKSVADAVSQTSLLPQPDDPAFDIVWDVYASTMAQYQNDLASINNSTDIDALAEKLVKTFEEYLAAEVDKSNA